MTGSVRRSPRSSSSEPGATLDETDLIAHTKTHLAGYKAPRRIRFVESIGRAPTGKVDYSRHAAETAAVGARESRGLIRA